MPATRFSALQRPTALLVIGLLVLVVCALVVMSAGIDTAGTATSADTGDRAAYDRIIDHMRAGQDYYDAARIEPAVHVRLESSERQTRAVEVEVGESFERTHFFQPHVRYLLTPVENERGKVLESFEFLQSRIRHLHLILPANF